MANHNTHPDAAGAPVSPHIAGDPSIAGHERRIWRWGQAGGIIDIYALVGSPEGVQTVAADAVGALAVVVDSGALQLWVQANPGANTGWTQLGTGGGGGGAVSSVFTRTGAVVAALNDYAASLVGNDSGVAGTTVKEALDALATLITSVANGLSSHAGDAGNPHSTTAAQVGAVPELTSGGTVHDDDFTAELGKVNYYLQSATLTTTLPDTGLTHRARLQLQPVPIGQGVLTISTGSKTLYGLSTSMKVSSHDPKFGLATLTFVWDAVRNYWVLETEQLVSGAFQMADNSALVVLEDNGTKHVEDLPLTAGTVLGVPEAGGAIQALPFADLVTTHNADPAAHPDVLHRTTQDLQIHIDGTNGDDGNDGSSGNPVLTEARACELALIESVIEHSVEIIIDGPKPGNAAYEFPHLSMFGSGTLTIRALMTNVTEVASVQTVATWNASGYLTVAGTPWTPDAHEGYFIEWLTGGRAGWYSPVRQHGSDWIKTIHVAYSTEAGYLPNPAPGDTFRLVRPSIPVSGPAGDGYWNVGGSVYFRMANVAIPSGTFVSLACNHNLLMTDSASPVTSVPLLGGYGGSGDYEWDLDYLWYCGLRTPVLSIQVGRTSRFEAVITGTGSQVLLLSSATAYFTWLTLRGGCIIYSDSHAKIIGGNVKGNGSFFVGDAGASSGGLYSPSRMVILPSEDGLDEWIDFQKAASGSTPLVTVINPGSEFVMLKAYTPTTEKLFNFLRLTSGLTISANRSSKAIIREGMAQYMGRGSGALEFGVDSGLVTADRSFLQGGAGTQLIGSSSIIEVTT